MNVLVIGKGGREYIIVWKVLKSLFVNEVFVVLGNLGMRDVVMIVLIDESS